MRSFQEVWGFFFDKLKQDREREHIFRYAGVLATSLQNRVRDVVRLLQRLGKISCPSLREQISNSASNVKAYASLLRTCSAKHRSVKTMIEILSPMDLRKIISGGFKGKPFFLNTSKCFLRSSAFHSFTVASLWRVTNLWQPSTSSAFPNFLRKIL